MRHVFVLSSARVPAVVLWSFLASAASAASAQQLELLPPIVGEESALPNPVLPDGPAAVDGLDSPVVEPEYSWYQPTYYFDPDIWDGSIELGVNGSSGNTETFNISAGYNLKRESEGHILSSDLKYFNSSTTSVQTQNYAIFNAGSEWKAQQRPWTVFLRTQLQFDEFQPYDLRVAVNSGLGYRWVDTDHSKVKLRFGAGASRDFGGGNTTWTPEALFGLDSEQKIGKRHKLISKLDYFPAWEDFSQYRLISDVSWQIVLDDATNLSLKLGVVTRFDNTPGGGSDPSDVNYLALLLWKL